MLPVTGEQKRYNPQMIPGTRVVAARPRKGSCGALRRAAAVILVSGVLVGMAPQPAVGEGPAPVEDAEKGEPAAISGLSTLKGKIEAPEGREIGGARILLFDAATSEPVAEQVLDRGGSFRFEELLQGYYRMIVDLDGERFLANRLLLLPPKKTVEVEFALGPVTREDEELGISAGSTPEGTDTPIAGVARLAEREGPGGLAWFKSGTGYAVLLGGGSALVALLVASSGSDDNPSDFDSSPASP